jgi:hypothetical protein
MGIDILGRDLMLQYDFPQQLTFEDNQQRWAVEEPRKLLVKV